MKQNGSVLGILVLGLVAAAPLVMAAADKPPPETTAAPVVNQKLEALRSTATSLEQLRGQTAAAAAQVTDGLVQVDGIAIGAVPVSALGLDTAFWKDCSGIARQAGGVDDGALKKMAGALDKRCKVASEAVTRLGRLAGGDRKTLLSLLPKGESTAPPEVDEKMLRMTLAMDLGPKAATTLRSLGDELFALSGALQRLAEQTSRNAYIEAGMQPPEPKAQKAP